MVVFGFAGSPKSQLEKMSRVYTEQGHRTLYCVLPQMVTFTYDMRKIRACAGQVLQKLEEQGVGEVVCHSLSNNGGVLYQQFTQMAKKKGSVTIKGAVFDSSPGPLGLQNVQRYFQLDGFATGIEKWVTRRQTPTFLPFHLFGVDMANRVPIVSAFGNVKKQLRTLCTTWKESKHIPWCGPYMKDIEQEEWPLLFIYAKNDQLLSWRYVEEVVRQQRLRGGREVLTRRFDTSGRGGHVAHLKYHPEEYKEAIRQLLNRLDLSSQ